MTEALQLSGSIAAALAASAAILLRGRRLRAAAMLAALALAFALVLGEAWHGQLSELRAHPAALAAGLAVTLALVAGLAFVCSLRREALPLLLLAALPFRVPIHTGDESSNLLIPLYVVIAAGVGLECARAWRGDAARPRVDGAPRWLAFALCAALVLYALQITYSSDVPRAVQNVAFFLAPFAVMFALLRDLEWNRDLLRGALAVIVAEAVIFALIGILQHQAHEIFWNAKVMQSNEFGLYFRVNSLFWDPNIYGRYLALAVLVAAATVVWLSEPRRILLGAVSIAVIFTGLVLSFSQTSFLALLVGLAVLCALRWSLRWTLIAGGGLIVCFALVVSLTSALNVDSGRGGELEQTTSGRSRLASGGLDLAAARPLAGYGSGSFAVEFEKRNPVPSGEAVISHTEPITVAAEQGALGLLAYLALVLCGVAVALTGMRGIAPGFGGAPPGPGPPPDPRAAALARIAVAVAFFGLLLHTLGYAGFLIDPLTWALLAIGSSLAAAPRIG